jgi:hypothetical protein
LRPAFAFVRAMNLPHGLKRGLPIWEDRQFVLGWSLKNRPM